MTTATIMERVTSNGHRDGDEDGDEDENEGSDEHEDEENVYFSALASEPSSVLLRHELNRVKAAGYAQEATFAFAVTLMSRLFNTASDVV